MTPRHKPQAGLNILHFRIIFRSSEILFDEFILDKISGALPGEEPGLALPHAAVGGEVVAVHGAQLGQHLLHLPVLPAVLRHLALTVRAEYFATFNNNDMGGKSQTSGL